VMSSFMVVLLGVARSGPSVAAIRSRVYPESPLDE
jgi:hypothetical protein